MTVAELVCPVHGAVRDHSGRGRCYRCEHDRNRERQRVRYAVRKPPRPPHERQAGVCSLCGTALTGRRRSWCSDECVRLWFCATSSDTALTLLLEVFGRRCWGCDATHEPGPSAEWDQHGHIERSWLMPEFDQTPMAGRRDYDRFARWRGDGPASVRPVLGPPLPVAIGLYVDHVRPLWSLTDPERLELRWWLPFNLQLLCDTCHAAKTRREAAERARLRRGDGPPPNVEQLELGAAS